MNETAVIDDTATAALAVEKIAMAVAEPDAAPFWEQAVYPDALDSILGDNSGARTYLVIDATMRIKAKGVFDLDNLGPDIPARSLFTGSGALDPSAPWLLDLNTASWARDTFLQDFFATQWGQRTGVFLSTPAPCEELFSHLRGVLKVRFQQDRDTLSFFRFWDPATAVVYFEGIHNRSERVDRLLRTRAGTPITLLAEDGPGQAACFTPQTGDQPQSSKVLTFDEADRQIFDRIALRSLATELEGWLRDAYPDRMSSLEAGQQTAFGRHVVRTGLRYGFQLKDEYSYLAHTMLQFGGWFAVSGLFPKCAAVLASGGKQLHKPMREALAADWATSHVPLLASRHGTLLQAVAALPGAPFVKPTELRALVETQCGADVGPVWALFDAMKQDFAQKDFTTEDKTALGLLSLFYGYRFYDDPSQCWVPDLDGMPVDTKNICTRAWAALTAGETA